MDFLEQLATAGAVLALLGVTLWWLRRRGVAVRWSPRRPAARKLEHLERLPLAPHHTLHLIRLGETALLVASTPSGCALLESRPCREIEGPEVSQ